IARRRGTTPERLRRALRGDLDTIVAKALKKKPEERYGSVAALAEDVSRYLEQKPILARPDSFPYKARKFARRHLRSLAALATLALALVAVAGFYGARLRRERARADRVSSFLTELLSQADPFVAGQGEPTVKSLLAAGAARVRKDLAGEPEFRRDMLTLLGRIYERRGDSGAAVPLLEDAVGLARKTLGPSPELAQGLNDLGVALGQRAELEAARTALEEALTLRQRFLGLEDPLVGVTESELGRTFLDQGRLEEAEAHFRAALAIRRKALGSAHHETATSMSDLGLLLRQKGDRAAAEALLREALQVNRAVAGPRHPDTGTALANLALTVSERGDLKAAESMFREALAISQASLGRDHPDNAVRMSNLAFVLRQRGKLAEAEALCRQGLALARPALGPDHPAVSRQEVGLARVYLDQGRAEAAEPLLRHALEIQAASYVRTDWRRGAAFSLLGDALTRERRFAEAEALLEQASELLHVLPDPDAFQTREALANR
ncbi:MAG TPA: tetratricopeptide repeat protein, partial [Thermoanaerobaculia bacterium]|nr:tetratricopeptide repeat protein [Thermoanaerobaculia bacterium]